MWWKVLGGLLALWLVVTVIGTVITFVGWVIKSLIGLAVLATVVVLAVTAIGWGRRKLKELR